MRKLFMAALISGAAAWSTPVLLADPPAEGDIPTAPVDAGPGAGPEDRPGPPDGPRDGEGRRHGPPPGERRGERPDFRRGEDGPPGGPRGERAPFRGPEFMPPLIRALDADGDHEISAEEIAKAAEALKTLDTNSDGKLTPDELRPQFAGRGPRGDEQGPPRGDGPPPFAEEFGRGGDGPPHGRDGEQGPPHEDGAPPFRRGFRRGGDGPPRGRDGERHHGWRGEEGERGRRHAPPHGERDGDRPRPPEGGPEGEPRHNPPPFDRERPPEDGVSTPTTQPDAAGADIKA